MNMLINLSVGQLKQAIKIRSRIDALESKLAKILGSSKNAGSASPRKTGGMSAAGRRRVAAAQKARWAKLKADKPKRRKMSASARAKIAAAAKARWARVKAAGKKSL